jgi:hypothetical protein
MTTRTLTGTMPRYLLLLATVLLFAAGAAMAQVPVDDEGNPIGSVAAPDESELPALSMQELEELIGPIALYPDDLLAIVLPASTYPLEIVQAARFLDELESNSSLQPDESWDESVTALLNYPEVLKMMNDDIDWTWKLGEAVVAQQSDVIAAVEAFRDRAYAAGNLKSDEHQTVSRNDDVIEIEPVDDDVIYVPYYEPAQVVVYQPRPVYHYYPRAYPVYYYPYPVGHHFGYDHFWGVTTAFSIGWTSNYLHVYHHSFHGHPYFGRHYYGHYWRRPTIQVFNHYYGNSGERHVRERHGSYWRPRHHGGARPGHYQARSRYYTNRRSSYSESGYADRRRDNSNSYRQGNQRRELGHDRRQAQAGTQVTRRQVNSGSNIRFRTREQNGAVNHGAQTGTAERRHSRNGRSTQNHSTLPSQQRNARSGNEVSRARIANSQRLNLRRSEPISYERQRAEPAAQGAAQRTPISPVQGRRARPSMPHRAPPARPSASPSRQAAPSAHSSRGNASNRNNAQQRGSRLSSSRKSSSRSGSARSGSGGRRDRR